MITITNNNIYYTDISISEYLTPDKLNKIEMDNIINFLFEPVELGESVTFKRIFEIISNNLDAFNEVFYSVLGGYSIEPYLQEIENVKTEDLKIDYIELYWFCEQYEKDFTILPELHGVNIKEKKQPYALDFISLNNIKDCIIKIDQSVKITDYSKKNKKYETNNLGNKYFLLFELFASIFTEITFHGGPQDKKEKISDIEKTIKELDELDMEIDATSFEDMIEKFESKDKYLVKYEELRDRVEKDRMEYDCNLDNLKSCLLEKLKIYHEIENSKDDKNLYVYYKKLTNIEYDLQMLYGEEEDISYHKFWLTPKCTCPKIDNVDIYPNKNPIFDKNCPIHKKSS